VNVSDMQSASKASGYAQWLLLTSAVVYTDMVLTWYWYGTDMVLTWY